VSGLTGGARESETDALATADSTTTAQDASRQPTTTEAPPTTAAPTTTAPTTVPPTTPPPPTTVPPTPVAPPPPPPASSASYRHCDEARAAGVAPLHRGDPGYAAHDRDNDGIACE
jgi:hypothetical protein